MRDLRRFLITKPLSSDGAFYASQDADVDEATPGKTFFALSADERAKLGRMPHIDTKVYSHENGWAISGLVAFYGATGDQAALRTVRACCNLHIGQPPKGRWDFSHGDSDRAGRYLGATLAMGQAALDLYAATGGRDWLDVAERAGDAIAHRLEDSAGGFRTTRAPEATVGAFLKEVRPLEE